MNSKRKGSAGERELLDILHQYGIRAERNDQRYLSGKGLPDILAEANGEELHIEAKRCETIRMNDWLAQAEYDAGYTPDRIPIVAFRKNRGSWYITLKLENLMKLLGIKRRERE